MRSKRIKNDIASNSIDRISALPDDVLIHILSFLSTQKSGSISILSNRWRFLWAHVPCLDFDANDYGAVTLMRFPYIIDEILSMHKAHHIHTLRLDLRKWSCPYSEVGISIAIATAIARNVQKLDIRNSDYEMDGNIFPGCLFTCKTLVDLSLHRCGDIPATGDVSLPRLKKLNLEMVMYESDDESLAHVLSGSPVLEELTIQTEHCMDRMVSCCISSPMLNRLVLEAEFNEFEYATFRVKIDTPALRYLKLRDWESQNVSAGRLPSLSEADIDFYNKDFTNILDSQTVIEFVGKLYNVKCLKLSTGWMEVSDSVFSDSTIKFHNLTELELRADWRFITYFLGNADNLRSLTIDMLDENLKSWMEPKLEPASLVSHLETVTFERFRCKEEAFNMVRYILRNAKVLKTIEIYFSYGTDLKERTETRKRISLFERGSEACQLHLH